jgi:uncharacterized membrane protein
MHSQHRSTSFLVVGVLLLGAGCGPADPPDSAATDSTAISSTIATGPAPLNATAGTLRLQEGVLRFTACGASGQGTALEDGTGGDAATVVSELGPDNGVTALVTTDGGRLIALHYAAPEGAPCEELPPAVDLEARGQEPFWFVSISGDVATVRTPEELDGVEYAGGHWSTIDAAQWRYDAARSDETLLLELIQERCVDGMSGARYPLKATLTRGGQSMSGCALQGRGAP